VSPAEQEARTRLVMLMHKLAIPFPHEALPSPEEADAALDAYRRAILDAAIAEVERTPRRDPRHSSVDRDDTSYATLSEDTQSDIVAALRALRDQP
jgi:hypothetical protein